MDVIVALMFDNFRELPDSETSSTKRQVTPFLYIGFPALRPTRKRTSAEEQLQRYESFCKTKEKRRKM